MAHDNSQYQVTQFLPKPIEEGRVLDVQNDHEDSEPQLPLHENTHSTLNNSLDPSESLASVSEGLSHKERVGVRAARCILHNLTVTEGLKRAVHAVKQYGLKGAVVTAELLPITNEGSRYGAFALTEAYSNNPILGALVLGGMTALVEGSSALAASSLVTEPTAQKLLGWLERKTSKLIPNDKELSVETTVGISMTLGTPVLLATQQSRHPERTKEEARKQGLLNAAWMSGVFAVEGALISQGIGVASGVPEKIGAGLLTFGALSTIPFWIKKVVRGRDLENVSPLKSFGKVEGVIAGGKLTSEQMTHSLALYERYRDYSDEAVKIGLYGEDLEAAYNNPNSILLKHADKKGETYTPLLVPVQQLTWYNMSLLKRVYGEETDFYYYAHPPIPETEESQTIVARAIKEKLDQGAIIFTDQYTGQPDAILDIVSNENGYASENLGGGNQLRTGEVFVAPVNVGVETISQDVPSIYDVYRQCIEDGEIKPDPQNGVSLVQTIEDDDAERIWEIYENPFDKLTEEHPMNAGFTKTELLDILSDPNVAKIINRVEGKISTLCFFVQDFDQCSWFNKKYYKEQYPEYYNTNNILIFPGIVTDEHLQGSLFSLPIMSLVTKLFVKRGSNMLITFECTETSATYIPKIVTFAINHSQMGARVEEIKEPISVSEYRALKSVNQVHD